jgi:hypothetical protein
LSIRAIPYVAIFSSQSSNVASLKNIVVPFTGTENLKKTPWPECASKLTQVPVKESRPAFLALSQKQEIIAN